MNVKHLLSAVFLVAVVFTGSGFGTVLIKMSVEDLSGASELAVRGRVEEINAQWNEEKTIIYSYVKISVKEVIKGEVHENEIYIKQYGGRIGDLEQKIIGAPVFKKGEEVIVFLNKDSRQINFFNVIGMYQGKFSIQGDQVKENNLKVNRFIGNIKQIIKSLENKEE